MPGFDGDINRRFANVPDNGDGNVDQQDLFWYDQFARGLHCPSDGPYNEFQRLDGNDNGLIDGGDYTYLANVFLGLTPKVAAKGPTAKPANLCFGVPTEPGDGVADTFRAIFAEITDIKMPPVLDEPATSLTAIPTSGAAGTDVFVAIRINAGSGERSTSTTIRWDPAIMAIDEASGIGLNPDVTNGPDAAPGQLLGVNATGAANGKLGLLIDFIGGSGDEARAAGPRQIVTLRFHIKEHVRPGTVSRIWFTDSVVPQQTVDIKGRLTDPLQYNDGCVMVMRRHR